MKEISMRKQSFNEKYYIYNVNNIQKNIYRNKNMHKKVRKLKRRNFYVQQKNNNVISGFVN